MRDIRAQAPRAPAMTRQQRVQHVVDHYAENPRASAKQLRSLGMPTSFIRAVHRDKVPNPKNRPSSPVGKRAASSLAAGFTGNKLLDRTLGDLGQAGLYALPGAAITAKNVAHDVYAALPKTKGGPGFKRTRQAGAAIGRGFAEDVRHPLRHPGYTLLDASALLSGGAGAAARGAASLRAIRAGESVARATTRKGFEGGSLLHAPEPGTVKLKVGEATVEKPLSRNAALRQVQRARYRKAQHRLDAGAVPEPAPTGPARFHEEHGAESLYGKELRHQRRLEQSIAHGEFTNVARKTRRLSRGQHAAMRVVAIEGKEALRNPEVLQRHIDTHRRLIGEGGDKASHEAAIRDLKLAAKTLENPPAKFLEALKSTRALANLGERESIARGFLSKETAAGRKQAIADVYGGKAGRGSFYFHAGPATRPRRVGRFYNPRPGEAGLGKVTPSRYAPELGRQFTGKGIRRGYVPLNVPQAVMQAYGRRVHLHSAHDLYETLRKASTEARGSRYQIPIRATSSIGKELKRYLATVEEHLHASPDELHALTRDELARLEQELKAAEHADAPLGANIKGVRWVDRRFIKDLGENPERGVLARTADAITNPTRFATLYLRPAYALNLLGNAGMVALEGPGAAHAMWEAARSEAKHGARNTARMDAAMGSGRALGQVVKTGFMHHINERVAGGWNAVTDLHMRRSAFLLESRRAGFHRKADLNRLLHDPKLRPKLNEVTRRARKVIGDYEDLGPTEKNAIRRLAYFYPWTKVATKWTGHALGEHPIKSAALAQNSRTEAEHAKRLLGKLPEWARVSGLVPIGKEHDGLLRTVNPSSVNTPATVVQTGTALANTARGLAGATHGSIGLKDLATPALEAFLTAGDQVQHGRHTGIPGVLESTPIPSALRRAGIGGEPSKTYPDKGIGPAVGPLGAGGLYPRNVSLEQLHKQARREERATMSPHQRALDDFSVLRGHLKQTVREQLGYKAIPPKLAKRLNLLEERAANRAKLGSNPTSLQKFIADARLIRKHGWANDARVAHAIRWARTASSDDISHELRHLTETYFDPDRVASDSLRWLNERAAVAAEVDWIAKSHQHDMAEARKWLRKNDFSIDDLRSARAYVHSHYRPPAGGWPSADALKVPR
jgi:hypothetical protein